jgi:putative flippase GtrA
MASPTNAVLDRITGGRGDKLLRFGMASVVGVVVTQALLVLFHGLLEFDATLSNVLAVVLAAIPVFFLNKRWVWGLDGRADLRREIVPFWGFTLLGLAISSGLVALSHEIGDSTLIVMAANIAGFGIVWVGKFVFLDSVVFGEAEAVAS